MRNHSGRPAGVKMLASAPFPAKRSASREEATPMHHPDTVPEAALRACPGYRIADAGEPVARSARSPAKRSASREEATPMHHPDTIPEAALRACPGYQIADAGKPVAPVSS
ncbi:hypothetical protein [Klebsiella michiganensis]|uniref:hypothetical protein n=1 Tax=Klebsiella michiganensis TaxID=1134687 RepID=UPI0021C81D91|nr:hypothetical protein [Klebsiella michiganensis]MEB6367678.1 hypothetical protein [Klebsiella michiganensis]UXO76980.1 hypothetical protein N7918_18420 [Klebsiella michiganensis]